MPALQSNGGPVHWNQPSLWTHIKAKTLPYMHRLEQEISPTQLLVSFLAARGLRSKMMTKATFWRLKEIFGEGYALEETA